MIELGIGEHITFGNSMTLEVTERKGTMGCDGCFFDCGLECGIDTRRLLACSRNFRDDGKDVIFKAIKN